MLDAVIDFMPAPTDIPPVKGTDENEQPTIRKADDSEKFSASGVQADDGSRSLGN